MKVWSDPRSPWGRRVWFDDTEIEAVMDEVRLRAGDAVFVDGQGVDVDKVLMEVYRVSPDFVDLGEGTLGRTEFGPDGSVRVAVSRGLAAEAESSVIAQRRLRSTLGHECAHIALHQHLHVLEAGGSLFPELEREVPRFLCRSAAIEGKPAATDWWEVQANRGMAALLLPRSLVAPRVRDALTSSGFPDMVAAAAAQHVREIIGEVQAMFDVSLQMLVYRLQDVGFMPKDVGQRQLAFGEIEGG